MKEQDSTNPTPTLDKEPITIQWYNSEVSLINAIVTSPSRTTV